MIVRSPKFGLPFWVVLASVGVITSAEAQSSDGIDGDDADWVPSRTVWGHPNLQGNWTNATLTPLERRHGLGPVYSPSQVEEIEGQEQARFEEGIEPSDPNRGPPPVTGSIGRSYNRIFYERGGRIARVHGEPRTSLITFPPDGRIPQLTPEGQRRKQRYEEIRSRFGEFDHPELRPLAERCIVFYGSSPASVMGPPMTPTGGYNNNFTIVQNADHVLIRSEMIHDVRIIRLGEPEPLPSHVRFWFGDSRGRWEGDTLVVETTNIHLDHALKEQTDKILHSAELRVLERFARVDEETILYEFEVHDPRTYSQVWGGQIPWKKFDQPIYEYACHEANYALENILSGARYQERLEARSRDQG